MKYTPRIQKAITLAIKTHEIDQQQKRKGKNIPYIVHPLTVGMILARAGADEDTVLAGILHDTIEDSVLEKKISAEIIAKNFGDNVANLVMSVTENDKSLSWEERKREAVEHIADFTHESLLVKSADILSNVSELLDDYDKDGEAVFERFNASKQMILKHYHEVIHAIVARWPQSPLAADMLHVGLRLLKIEVQSLNAAEPEIINDLYLNEEQQKYRRIAFVHCEDEDCGFGVEFKHPNCTFFFCKEHGTGFNIDLADLTAAGVECELHGKMERYNVLTEDNVCPRCKSNTLAILSVGSE